LNLNYEAEKGNRCLGAQISMALTGVLADTTDEQQSLKHKTLLINCTKDEIAVPALQTFAAKPFIPELEVRELNTAHWAHLEAPDAVSAAIENFFG
jgi:pimeloyl-ACP methyl ester carboxylesterase